MAAITLVVTSREHAAVLAGLRLLQNRIESGTLIPSIADIATNGGKLKALSAEEIDGLCEKSNHK